MKKITLITLLLLGSYSAFCQDIYTYVAASTAGAPSFIAPNITTASNLTPVGTGFNTPCTQGFSGIDGFTGGAYSSSGPCIQITLTAAPGYAITATGFKTHIRGSSTGPTLVRLAYSSDGGTTWTDNGINSAPYIGGCATSTAGTNLVSWTTFSVTNPTLLFRVYPFGASGSTGTVQIYDLDIIGSVNPSCPTLPTITVSSAVSNICTGGSGASITASGAGAGGTYTWVPAIGLSPATGATVTATPGASIVYTVTGTTSVGCSNKATATVSVNPLPTIAASSALSTVCSGSGTTLTGSGAGAGGVYTWSPAVSLSSVTGSTVIASPASQTVYTVTGATSAGCSHTATVTVSINPSPAAVIALTGPTTFCPGGSATLTASSGTGYTYNWYNGTTLLAGFSTNTYDAITSGNYKVTTGNSFGCTTTSTPVLITVSPLPAAAITAAGSTSFCAGNSVLLNASAGSGYSYQWYENGVAVPGAIGSSYMASATGNVTVKVTSAFSCSNTSSALAVTAVTLPALAASGATTFCAGGSVLLSVNTGGATAGITYQWERGGTPMGGATNATYTGMLTGDYSCVVNVGGTCIDTTAPEHVIVHPAPNPVITSNSTELSTANSYASYQWYVNTVGIPGAISYSTPIIMSIHNGSYTVKVTDANGCTGISGAYGAGPHSGLAVGTINGSDIKVYPNPASNALHIEATVSVRAIISSIDGKIIMEQTNAHDIQVSSLANGMYLIALYDDNGEQVLIQKFVKQ